MPPIVTAFAALGTIFGLAFFHFWSAVPAGLALGINPAAVVLTVTASYGSGAALVVLVGAPLRERIRRRMGGEDTEPGRMLALIQDAWERFGLVGLALLAPLTVGSQVGAVIGLGFGANPWRLVLALTAGAATWAVLIALAILAGAMTVSQL